MKETYGLQDYRILQKLSLLLGRIMICLSIVTFADKLSRTNDGTHSR